MAREAIILDGDNLDTPEGEPCHCSKFVNATTGERTGCTRTTRRDFAPGHDAKLKGFLIRAGIKGQQIQLAGAPEDEDALEPTAVANRYGFSYMVHNGIKRGLAVLQEKEERKAARAAKKAGRKTKKADRDDLAATEDGKIVDEADREHEFVEGEPVAVEVSAPAHEPEWDDEEPKPEMVGALPADIAELAGITAQDEPQPETVRAKVGRWEYDGFIEDGRFCYTNKKGEEVFTTKYALV